MERRIPSFDVMRAAAKRLGENTREYEAVKPDSAEAEKRVVIDIGSVVTLEYIERNKTIKIKIISDIEPPSKPQDGLFFITDKSPVAMAIMGRSSGEETIGVGANTVKIVEVIND